MIGAPSRLRLIRKVADLARMFPTLTLTCEDNTGLRLFIMNR